MSFWAWILDLEHRAERWALGLHFGPDASAPAPAGSGNESEDSPLAAILPAPRDPGDDPIAGPAYAFLASWSPADRRALLELQRGAGLDPKVGGLLAVVSAESGGHPDAQFPPAPAAASAAGLFQLTRGARLPGFSTPAQIQAVTSWSPARQARDVGAPLLARMFPRGAGAAQSGPALRRRFFLPGLADKGSDFVLGVRAGATGPSGERPEDVIAGESRGAIYAGNYGFDAGAKKDRATGAISGGRGWFTWADVDAQTARIAASAAPRGWMRVSGAVVPPGDPARGGATGGATPTAPRAPSRPSGPMGTGLLAAAALAGTYVRPTWVEVPGPDGMTLTVAADDLAAPVAAAGGAALRLFSGWPEAVEIARALTDQLGVPVIAGSERIARAVRDAAAVKTAFHSQVTAADPDSGGWKMQSLAAAQRFNADVDAQVRAAGRTPGDGALVAGANKWWILHPWLSKTVKATGRPAAVNFGAWDQFGHLSQEPGARHDVDYRGDDSQVFRAVQRFARGAGGERVDLLAWIRDREGVEQRFVDLFDFGGINA